MMILECILILILTGLLIISGLFLLALLTPIDVELGNPNSEIFHLKIKSQKADYNK